MELYTITPQMFGAIPDKKKLNILSAIRLARENNITLEFHPKSVCATKERHSSLIKYAQCKNQDEATILAIEDCLERFNFLTRAH